MFCLLHGTVPHSSPRDLNVTSITSSSITLAWASPPPEDRNGAVVSYTVNIQTVAGDATMQHQSTDTEFTITSLDAHTSYAVSVAAQTSIGTGPFTSEVQVTTMEDGKGGIYIHTIVFYNSIFNSRTF